MRVDEIPDHTARSIAFSDIDEEHQYVQTAAQALVQTGYGSAIFQHADGNGSVWEVGMGRRVSAFVKGPSEARNSKVNDLGKLDRTVYEYQQDVDAGSVVVFTGAIAGIMTI